MLSNSRKEKTVIVIFASNCDFPCTYSQWSKDSRFAGCRVNYSRIPCISDSRDVFCLILKTNKIRFTGFI